MTGGSESMNTGSAPSLVLSTGYRWTTEDEMDEDPLRARGFRSSLD